MTAIVNDQAAAFDGHLDAGECPALIVIDVCDAYLLTESPLYAPRFADALAGIGTLLEAARSAGAPIIHTRVVYQAGGADGGLFYRKIPALKVFDQGSPFGRFASEAVPRPGEVIVTKQYASAFSGTSLLATLNALRVDSLVICGFSTSGCVRATATDAIQFGIAPLVVRDGCADRSDAIQDANLIDLQAKYAEVIGVAAAVRIFAR